MDGEENTDIGGTTDQSFAGLIDHHYTNGELLGMEDDLSELRKEIESQHIEAFKIAKQPMEERSTGVPFKPTNVTVKESSEPPASIYKDVRGRSLTGEYLGLKDLEGQFGSDKRLETLEKYFIGKLKEDHRQDTREGFYSLLQEIETILKLTPQHDPFYRLEKVHKYAIILNKEQEIMRLKRRLMGAVDE